MDTNILLRISKRHDAWCLPVREALKALIADHTQLTIAPQNVAEFWNVCTRPKVNNGYGLSVVRTNKRLQQIERGVTLLSDRPDVYVEWRRLLLEYKVIGAQVHDARLVAAMRVNGIRRILTLNDKDFRRYDCIEVLHPRDIVNVQQPRS